ncbi:MAG: hypothetical protein ABI877_12520 [Gemmatimonadaceae bacterium]
MPNEMEPLPRRSFVGRLASAMAAFGSTFAASDLGAQPATAGDRWEAERHPQDDWLDRIPGKHRYFFDTSSANGAGEAITFASNYFAGNKSGYGLEPPDLAVVICLRHSSTPLAYTDEVWAKYGAIFADRMKFNDPKTNAPPTVNVYQQSGYGTALPNRGTTFDMLVERGVHFAVCDMATRAYAGIVAGKLSLVSDAVYEELKTHNVGNCHFVPAGIIAVNRAQERGYSIVSMH